MNNGKASVQHSIDKIEISLPSKKNWFALIFCLFWLVGWYWGFSTVFGQVRSGEEAKWGFMSFWLVGWTLGGLTVMFLLLWGFFGKERIEINSRELILEKTIFGMGIKKKLDLPPVTNFRQEIINEHTYSRGNWAFWGFGPGKIKFDYGLRTYSFGLGVDDAEAHYLVGILAEKIGEK